MFSSVGVGVWWEMLGKGGCVCVVFSFLGSGFVGG